ncbi:thiosulfate reductase cytochrome b subunit [Microbacterium sp. ZKA21]|uniref:cytochrome b/b6 domain-containing protein n=1 Tax=Microbacterium sp. ZKA21 TaxID=3381694 RepID=UPI003D20F64B
MLRRGLPRLPGGEPWPPADVSSDEPASAVVTTVVGATGAAAATGAGTAGVGTAGAGGAKPGADTPDVGPSGEERPTSGVSAPRTDAGDATTASHTASRALRRGLPRTPGGESWPPADSAPTGAGAVAASHAVVAAVPADASDASAPASTPAPDVGGAAPVATLVSSASVPPGAGDASSAAHVAGSVLRRGLPRTRGGEPWPPAGIAVAAPSVAAPATAGAPVAATLVSSASGPPGAGDVSSPAHVAGSVLRRGLPRTPGGESWPPAGTTVSAAEPASTSPGSDTPDVGPIGEERPTGGVSAPQVAASAGGARDVSVPLAVPRAAWNGVAPRHAPAAASETTRPTWTQAVAGLLGLAGLGILGIAAIAFVRTILSTPVMMDFLAAFPGEYHLPEGTALGIPGWVGWQHFFNMFLMVLIIRTGLTVRAEKRPTVFWTSKRNPKYKISLTLWLHQALDVLWLVNGVIFVVLLFTTGHWVRVVPTSWEVFPNALSAGLQYVSLDWPTENGWANYNSLQQLAYFTTIFVAAPLAAITGVRMSGIWPKNAEKLNRAYPVEWARAVHFPVMIYFIAFIVVHVILVMATGALRNLNHMYASQDLVSWTGFWVFVASLVVIAIGWFAARPLIVAPIAKGFGNVSGR